MHQRIALYFLITSHTYFCHVFYGRITTMNAVNAVLLFILVCFTAVCQAEDKGKRINFT